MWLIDRIAESRIEKALADGVFDNLSGAGKAVDLDDNRLVPETLRIAYRILKNANCLPREIELRSQIQGMRTLVGTAEDPQERAKINRKLAMLILSLNLAGPDRLDPRSDRHYGDSVRRRALGIE